MPLHERPYPADAQLPRRINTDEEQNLDVFDFTLADDEMTHIATMDTGASPFFDHRDPAMVSWLNSRRDTEHHPADEDSRT